MLNAHYFVTVIMSNNKLFSISVGWGLVEINSSTIGFESTFLASLLLGNKVFYSWQSLGIILLLTGCHSVTSNQSINQDFTLFDTFAQVFIFSFPWSCRTWDSCCLPCVIGVSIFDLLRFFLVVLLMEFDKNVQNFYLKSLDYQVI